jgi:site-specific DNA-methyltransferase (adenine-specific)
MMELDRIYNEDCLQGMRRMEAESVDLTVTSPPYDNLRTYNGYCFDFENIARELYRVTKQGGVVVWVVGDATIEGSETGTSFRQALFFMEIGFRLHDTMIYASDKPPLNTRRYEPKFEYMFVFSKESPKTFNGLKEASIQAGRKSGGSTFRNIGTGQKDRWSNVPTPDEKLRGNIWYYATGNQGSTHDSIAFKHPAIFPESLAADHIRSWSNEGDIVLDPFMGSGTTAKVARALNRHYIGFEISAEYCDIINKRLEQTKTLFDL